MSLWANNALQIESKMFSQEKYLHILFSLLFEWKFIITFYYALLNQHIVHLLRGNVTEPVAKRLRFPPADEIINLVILNLTN